MYAKKFECPECSKFLFQDEKKCECGWSKKEEKKSSNNFCSFVLNSKQCRLGGSISPHTRADAIFYCTYHFQFLDEPVESARWVRFIDKNFSEINHFRCHYQTNFKNCERCQNFQNLENEFKRLRTNDNVLPAVTALVDMRSCDVPTQDFEF